MQHLRVLDAPARIGHRPLLRRDSRERLRVQVEHDAIAAVADGVRFDLDPVAQRCDEQWEQLLFLVDQQSDAAGRIAVRGEQGRTPGTERAVDVELDASDHESIAALHARRALPDQALGVRSRSADRVVEPQLDPPASIERAEPFYFRERVAGNLQLRPTHTDAPFGADFESTQLFSFRERRNQARHEVHGSVDEHARRFARLRVLQDLSAGRIRGRASDAGKLERAAVGDDCVTVGALEDHRAIRDRSVEIGAGGKRRRCPTRFDPAASEDPVPGLGCRRPRFQARLQVGNARRAFQIEGELAHPDTGQVCMRVGEARHDRGTLEIDELGIAWRALACVSAAADKHDASVRCNDCLGLRLPLIPRVNVAVEENQRIRSNTVAGERLHDQRA